jgi:hypothetical protein
VCKSQVLAITISPLALHGQMLAAECEDLLWLNAGC